MKKFLFVIFYILFLISFNFFLVIFGIFGFSAISVFNEQPIIGLRLKLLLILVVLVLARIFLKKNKNKKIIYTILSIFIFILLFSYDNLLIFLCALINFTLGYYFSKINISKIILFITPIIIIVSKYMLLMKQIIYSFEDVEADQMAGLFFGLLSGILIFICSLDIIFYVGILAGKFFEKRKLKKIMKNEKINS